MLLPAGSAPCLGLFPDIRMHGIATSTASLCVSSCPRNIPLRPPDQFATAWHVRIYAGAACSTTPGQLASGRGAKMGQLGRSTYTYMPREGPAPPRRLRRWPWECTHAIPQLVAAPFVKPRPNTTASGAPLMSTHWPLPSQVLAAHSLASQRT